MKKIARILFFPVLIVYFETILKISSYDNVFNAGYVFMCLFSLPAGIVFFIATSAFSEKWNKIIYVAVTSILTFYYAAQMTYFKIFSTFASLYFFIGAGKAAQFMDVLEDAVLRNIHMLILMLIPSALSLIFVKKMKFPKNNSRNIKFSAAAALCLQIFVVMLVLSSDKGMLSSSYLYRETFLVVDSIDRFGLLTTGRLDIQNILKNSEVFASESEPVVKKEVPDETNSEEKNPIVEDEAEAEYNVMDIDFAELASVEGNKEIRAMHEYFGNLKPTEKNKYTGMFKGKNLIMITAEGFSPYAVDEKLTPTLYKMQQEGFRFTDFYTPLWGVSTSDGEYVACTSLLPKEGIWSFYKSSENYMPFAMGNQLKNIGYTANAYHDHYFDYYFRNLSHPNLGYEYKGLGNGLDVTETWPESDIEMMELTIPEYIDNQPFHTYYMTVSGHLQYTFSGNFIASKNRALVEDLPYSERVKAYIACNIELDRAMEKLIKSLEAKGIADDTLIAISPDHYPYGLEKSEISELAGHEISSEFDLYKGIFILWSEGMEPVEINKTCSSLDIIPTLSNLMGVEYDSRLLMGSDILSDSQPLVMFSDRSWVTDKVYFDAKTGTAAVKEGQNINDSYVEEISSQVKDKFKYAAKILDDDYYSIVLGNK